jgi:coproporphyrinogen III oxidase
MVARTKNGKRIGRPTKLTAKLTDRICEFIRGGNYISTACAACGISTVTFNDWKARGEKEEEPYSTFLAALKKAEVDCETRLLAIVDKAAEKNWPAAMTLLERRDPDKWGRRTRQEITGKGGGPVEFRVIYDDPPPSPSTPEKS